MFRPSDSTTNQLIDSTPIDLVNVSSDSTTNQLIDLVNVSA